MANKKKKTVKTMDIVAPKKKTKKTGGVSPKNSKAVKIDIDVNEIPTDVITEEVEEITIEEEPIEEDKPMQKKPEPEMRTKEEVKKSSNDTTPSPKAKKSPAKIIVKIISLILVLAAATSVGFLIFNISRSNLLPAKFFYPTVAILAVIALLFLWFTLRRKTKIVTHIIIDILSAALLAGSLFCNLKLNDTLTFLDKNLNGATYQTLVYNVLTGADSKYNSKESLADTNIISPPDFVLSEDELITAVRDQAGANLTFNDNNDGVTNLPLADSDALILLNNSIYDSMAEAAPEYRDKTKIVTTIKIEKKVDKGDNGVDLASKPFLMFLSGIDSRDGLTYTSLSDVNIAIAVNPKTAQILLLTIPRDYQIHIPGTPGGLNDKVTHAGLLGGLQLSRATIEELMGVKFDEYIRVSFDFVVGLVNAIGGIELYSDQGTPFTCWTNPSCTFQPGNNYVYGDCALAFARERMTYATGDTHRAENQQQVIEKIFSKITNSGTLINNYSAILDSLSGTFETSLTTSDISSLVRLQLDKFPSWKVHSYTLATTGHDELYTYTFPNEPLYVAYQDPASIAKGKQMIQEILNGN